MLIVGLGEHDMILGCKWFEVTGVLIDCKNRCLIWPESDPKEKSWAKILTTTKKNLESIAAKQYQEDADRRDKLMDKEPRTILRRLAGSLLAPTWKGEQAEQYRKMQEEFKGKPPRDREAARPRPKHKKGVQSTFFIDICGITAAAFQANLRRENNTFFATSLYEIGRELEDRVLNNPNDAPPGARRAGETELQWLRRVLPKQFADYADTFSQEASNELPPRRSYDHKITIDDPKGPDGLGYSPLHHHSEYELQEMKRFLEENLQRGFIEPSQAPYASPVLFIKKPSGALRFCVDYRKLNALTHKDRYLLPLIGEILARLARAKVYTKLDIRQTFHRIRMDPSSEEL